MRRAYENGAAELQAKVKVRVSESVPGRRRQSVEEDSMVDTTIGRALLSDILPEGMPLRAGQPR